MKSAKLIILLATVGIIGNVGLCCFGQNLVKDKIAVDSTTFSGKYNGNNLLIGIDNPKDFLTCIKGLTLNGKIIPLIIIEGVVEIPFEKNGLKIGDNVSLTVVFRKGCPIKCLNEQVLQGYGQNLVINGSFEEYTSCTEGISQFNFMKGWRNPTAGSPDYFSTCMNYEDSQVPDNMSGYQFPHSGKAYAGIIARVPYHPLIERDQFINGNREYIEGEFLKPLVKDKQYSYTMYFCLASGSNEYLNKMEVLFSPKPIHYGGVNNIDAEPQIKFDITDFTDTLQWKRLNYVYTADGGEKYFIIGVFAVDKNLKIEKRKANPAKHNGGKIGAYYFIDDVSLVDVSDTGKQTETAIKPVPPESSPKEDFNTATEKPVILKNVFFETGKSTLLPTSYSELDLLVAYLKKKSHKIEINGHTDNVGKEVDNLHLSEARAKAVSDYLISKGILATRISHKGFGSTVPIAGNDTEQGRQQNRRVEFKCEQY